MQHTLKLLFGFLLFLVAACTNQEKTFDATGLFEADEVMVSAETGGKILSFPVREGEQINKGQVVALVDSADLVWQVAHAQASIAALQEKTSDVEPNIQLLKQQIAVQQVQLTGLEREKKRTQHLLAVDVATPQQLDDITTQVDMLQQQIAVTQRQIKVQQTQTSTHNRSVLSEKNPLRKRLSLLQEQLGRTRVVNPLNGTLLVKYAEAGETASPGKPLYKIADLTMLNLRAYLTGDQLTQVKQGQEVRVWVDRSKQTYTELPGTVYWISSQAEFTPKTIQTKQERANLVYAVKIRVKNNGYLKLGMYGEVDLGHGSR